MRPAPVYRAPRWLPGGHLQTIWSARVARHHVDPAVPPRFRRERWTTPDGDFVDADWREDATPLPGDAPLLVLFHGLEGNRDSQYVQSFADLARRRGWGFVLPHFRGCSGELNLAPRAYHSGDHAEIGWMLDQVRARHAGPLHAVGVSLGGNALLRWAEEQGDAAGAVLRSLAAVCSPIDLAAGGHALGRGLARRIYTPMFLRTMKPKALAKLAQHPGLFDRERLLAAQTLHAFDDVFTAPLHGFRDADDYWARASAKPALADIRLPSLLVHALNDPFVPAASLPRTPPPGGHVRLWQAGTGGHVGFADGAFPGHVLTLPAQVLDWLAAPA
ncbi:YheT family hydrolase [Sphaerotilus mobilis]|uniref:AB hydrolase-1 domain-containing protein n=1 Tax=Sphaerotilus mobilis TaxID=47994 RepID=A0A4V2EX84_9BURK|nr:alpha/beta fold hydrolase [Sphaerotilus mobilis]RZS58600.1 hypothetical protein EV685_0895 [Sphaerotilus mobilis]